MTSAIVIFNIVLQSGTVGKPKAVMLSHDNLVHDAQVIFERVRFVERQEIIVSFLPLSHVAAQVMYLSKSHLIDR